MLCLDAVIFRFIDFFVAFFSRYFFNGLFTYGCVEKRAVFVFHFLNLELDVNAVVLFVYYKSILFDF